MSRKRASKAATRNSHNVYELEQALANQRALREGPSRRKTWSTHDIRSIKALTPPQCEMIHDFIDGQNIIASGTAGTGKTFVALYLALHELLSPNTDIDKLIIVRSAVPTREEGFLPGTAEEKAAMYEKPYGPLFAELMGRQNTYEDMKEAGLVVFETTSFQRGVTWNNAVVVVDEVQSLNFHEINTIMTRMGRNSRIILCGDVPQTDLRKKYDITGMTRLLNVAAKMSRVSVVTFTRDDIVRDEFVKEWIIASEETPE